MAKIVPLFPAPAAKAERECAACRKGHGGIGVLCLACRTRQAPAPGSFAASTVATTILELERWSREGHPLADPVARALDNMRKVYDAVAPRLLAPVGHIHVEHGEFWALPDSVDLSLGPFATEEAAQTALLEYASRHTTEPQS